MRGKLPFLRKSMLLLQRRYSLHLLPVPFTLRFTALARCSKPCVQNLSHLGCTCSPKAKSQYIRVIINSGASGRLCITRECTPNAGNFVRRDRHSCPCPAADNPFIHPAIGDGTRNIGSDQRPIAIGLPDSNRSIRKELMAARFELRQELLCQFRCLITANGYSHGV